MCAHILSLFYVLVTAPEILSSKEYSRQADVYSFGVLVWSVYTQQLPYLDIKSIFGTLLL